MALPLDTSTCQPDADAPEEVRGLLNVDTALHREAGRAACSARGSPKLSSARAKRVFASPSSLRPSQANATLHPAAAVQTPAPPPPAIETAAVEPTPVRSQPMPMPIIPAPSARRWWAPAYLTPEPGADPFVSVGSEVREGANAADRRGDEGDEPDQSAEERARSPRSWSAMAIRSSMTNSS